MSTNLIEKFATLVTHRTDDHGVRSVTPTVHFMEIAADLIDTPEWNTVVAVIHRYKVPQDRFGFHVIAAHGADMSAPIKHRTSGTWDLVDATEIVNFIDETWGKVNDLSFLEIAATSPATAAYIRSRCIPLEWKGLSNADLDSLVRLMVRG